MASNTTLNVGVDGDKAATKERTHDGDAAKVQVVTVAGVTGTEGSYTFADIAPGGGVEANALRVTLASDSTGVVSVDDNGGSITIDGTVELGATALAALETITIASVTAPLAAGTNAIGKLAANSGVDIGDVDVLTVPADPFGANADAASATGSISAKLRFIANTVLVDDAAFTPGTSSVNMAGFQADETATDSVDEGDAGAARITLDRKQIVTQFAHAAAGGHTPYKNLDVDESEDEIKGSGGKLFWVHAMNLAATKRYLKIYNNTAAGVTVGTTVPDLTFPLPTLGDTNGSGFCINFGDHGLALGTGITVAATTGFADNDTGAPSANDVILNAGYL